MGDLSDFNDLERFMRSPEGDAHLREIAGILERRTVLDVHWSNETGCIALTLHLDNGDTFVVYPPSLDVGVLREEFGDVIDREYYKDYPDRAPRA